MDNLTIKKINEKNLIFNLNEIKKLTKNKKICAMVKANAYGHGVERVVKALINRVDNFGVASLKEALEIKNLFKNIKIIIFGRTINFKKAIENNISFTIYNLEDLKLLIKTMNNYALNAANIHLKINCGMNRFGIKSVAEFKDIYSLALKNNINVEGVFTHFSTADCDYDIYQKQKRIFKSFLKEIPNSQTPVIHVGGSSVLLCENGAISTKKPYIEPNVDLNYDMQRCGIMLYGYGGKKLLKLKRVMKIETEIIAINNVKMGELIGYGTSYLAKENMKVGVIPIGYADGMARAYAKKGNVVIKSKGTYKTCKIVGNICMDSTILDITNLENIEIGTKVIVLFDAEKMAKKIETIPYEVLTNFNKIRE